MPVYAYKAKQSHDRTEQRKGQYPSVNTACTMRWQDTHEYPSIRAAGVTISNEVTHNVKCIHVCIEVMRMELAEIMKKAENPKGGAGTVFFYRL